MKYRYDHKADILLIELGRGKFDFGKQKGNVIMHYNKKGVLLEIEILDASKTVEKAIQIARGRKRVKAYA